MPQLLIALAAGIAGFILARNFVRRRLRFVDSVHSPIAPLIAGCVAALVAWPAVLLPMVTLSTAHYCSGSVLDWALPVVPGPCGTAKDGVVSLPEPYYCVVRNRPIDWITL